MGTAPIDVDVFRKDSLTHLALQRGGRTIHVYLYAEDEKVDVLNASFCGGNEGAKQYSGHFHLISVADNAVVSRLDLDPDDTFVEKKPHDGARLIHDPKSGQYLVAIYQYESCSIESVQVFAADPSGRLFLISFLDRDGRTWKQALTGADGAVRPGASGDLMFCGYDNAIAYDLCGAYVFDGANFIETDKWMTQNLENPAKGRDDTGQAARALFEFLSELSVRGYSEAAYFLDSNSGGATSEGPVPTEAGQKATFLENYCTVKGGQCLTPVDIERKPDAGARGTLLFKVSFQTSDFKPLNIGPRSSFDFRVAKTPDGFKVLDLPPHIP
ncbi:MAG: hypothetical protein ACLQVG_27895 [Terriglobia bacterium]